MGKKGYGSVELDMVEKGKYSISKVEKELAMMIEASLGEFHSVECFERFVRDYVRPIIPHRSFFAGLGLITVDELSIELMVPVDYPDGFVDQVSTNIELSQRRVILEWLKLRRPLLLDIELHGSLMSELEKHEIQKFGLGRLGVHGQIDVSGRMASYFSFSQIPTLDDSFASLIEIVSPHLHTALMRTAQVMRAVKKKVLLSEAELRVLKCIVLGMSNKEIANALGKSERTVKNQVHALLGKIGAKNRAEVITISDGLGLLSPAREWII